jgi:hypothetical protein
MKILGQSSFNHQFYIDKDDNMFSSADDQTGARGEIIKWCSENCKSRWILTTATNVSVYAPLQFDNPISNKKFPAAKMDEYSKMILMFEDDDEAAGFKMTFVGK